jgi:hypothetical protein
MFSAGSLVISTICMFGPLTFVLYHAYKKLANPMDIEPMAVNKSTQLASDIITKDQLVAEELKFFFS